MTKGFTLLELMIASAIFAIISAIALSFSVAATKQTEINTRMAYALSGIVRLLDTVKEELGQSSEEYVGYELVEGQADDGYPDGSPDWGQGAPDTISIVSDSITFRKLIRYNTVRQYRIWSTPITYQLGLNRGEVNNGIDDNGNGFVDELCLHRQQDGKTTFPTTELLFEKPSDLKFTSTDNYVTMELKYMLDKGYKESISTSMALHFFAPAE